MPGKLQFKPLRLNPFYLSAFVWNLSHGLGGILVPLYALHLGMSGVAIGSLVALPVILQVIFNLLGGAYVDRIGARNVMAGSNLIFIIGNIVYAVSTGLMGLMIAQSLFVLARSSFWPASYALVSRLPGERSRNLGVLNSATNGGMIGGTALAGVLIGLFGYQTCFIISIGILALAFALALLIRAADSPVSTEPHQSILTTYKRLARVPAMYFAVACGYISVLPFTLSASFFPILLVWEGFTAEVTGWLLTLRAFGSILAGIGLARTIRSPTGLSVPLWSGLIISISIATAAMTDNIWLIGISIFVFGVASGLVSIYFQLLVSTISVVKERGAAISFGGLGWQASNISTPLIMGFLMDGLGLRIAFYLMAGSLLLLIVVLPALHRWSLKGRSFPDSR